MKKDINNNAAEEKAKKNQVDEAENKKKPAVEDKIDQKTDQGLNPTLTMQGVSGKIITGVVKVVKKAKKASEPDNVSETTTKVESKEVETTKIAPSVLEKKVEKPKKVTETPKKTAVKASSDKTSVAEKPVAEKAVKKESPKSVKKSEPVKKETAVTAETIPSQAEQKTIEKTAPVKKVKPEVKQEVKKVVPTASEPTKVVPKKTLATPKDDVLPGIASPKGRVVGAYAPGYGPGQKPAEKKPVSSTNERRPYNKYQERDTEVVRGGYSGANYSSDARPNRYNNNNGQRPPYANNANRGGGGFSRDNNNRRGPGFAPSRDGRTGFGGGMNKDEDDRRPPTRSPKAAKKSHTTPEIGPEFNKKTDSRNAYQQKTNHDKNKHRHENKYHRQNKGSYDDFTDLKRRKLRSIKQEKNQAPVVRTILTHVSLPEILTVKEFSEAIKKTSSDVIMKLMNLGVIATLNREIDYDTAAIIAAEFGIETDKLVVVTEEDILFDDSEDQDTDMVERPPVVVVMGHVDHGKTSILDYIRKAKVVSGEAGGITQHIGAYTTNVNGRKITFLDTPGHEAFTTMRARGAQVTDIAILVVAADDGVMPQTIEAINHAKAANTEVIVAINKIDRPAANVDKVKQELANHEIISEDWGGTTVMVPVSAKTGEGMDELLEMVLLTADVLELKSNPDKQAKGTVIEAKLDKSRGPVATLLVQRGTLRSGDTIVVGNVSGHVRAMNDDRGKAIKKAGPSIPVEILGLSEVPEAGEIFYAVENEKIARSLVSKRQTEERADRLSRNTRMTLDNLFKQMSEGEVKDLNLIVKADVQGSVEAVKQSLEKLSNEEVKVRVIHGAVGAVTESDIRLAEVSNAIVIGFNVRPTNQVSEIAQEIGVDVRLYRVIYNAIEDIEAAMKGLLAPTFKEVVLGHAEIREIFKVSGVGTISGAYVIDGIIKRAKPIRIIRDGIVVHEGELASLRRFKEDVKEVSQNYECGIGIEKFNDLKVDDVVESYEMQEVKRD